MIPLHIIAHLGGPVRIQHQWISLDSLLVAAICKRDDEPPLLVGETPVDYASRLDGVLKRSECGRLWLASWLSGEPEGYEKKWVNKRPPIAEALGGDKVRTISIGGGPMKAMHRPSEAIHFKADRLDAWTIGDLDQVRALLEIVGALGFKRNAGDGVVRRWDVEQCEPWAGGFPVVLDGVPLRPLPLDWPGLDLDRCGRDTMPLQPPYWHRDPRDRVEVAVPVRR